MEYRLLVRAIAFWPTAAVGEADHVSSMSASGDHSSEPKGASAGEKTLLHGTKSQKLRRAVVKNFLNPANFETTYVLILIKEFSEIFYYLIIQRSYNTLVPREMLVPPQ